MTRTIDANSPVPVRLQLRSILIAEIDDGVYLPNQRIPSERDLAERYAASRASVREVIAELISAGLLFRSGGRGTFVSERPARRGETPPEVYRQIGFWISEQIFHFIQAGYTRILTGAEEECRAAGFSLAVHSIREEAQSLDLLFANDGQRPEAAGHIVAGGLRKSILERIERLNKPLALVDPLLRTQVEGIDTVRIGYGAGTREAVRHLVGLGHREIGFIGFPASEKYEAFWHALEENGVPYAPRFVQFLQLPDLAPSAITGFQAMNRLLAAPTRPSAVIMANDYLALGALEALAIAGVAVPEEMSLIGFDDIGQGGVPLTTVSCDLVEAGRLAARAVLDRIADPSQPCREAVVPVKLLARRSSGVCAQPVATR